MQQFSSDGRWWWDGSAWHPVPPSAPPPGWTGDAGGAGEVTGAEAHSAPIPSSYYEAPPQRAASGRARTVLVAGGVVLAAIVLAAIVLIALHNWVVTVLAGLVLVVVLAFNVRGLRTRAPLLRSSNRFTAAGGWTVLALCLLLLLVISTTPGAAPSQPAASVGGGGVAAASATPSDTPIASVTPSPMPYATPKPSAAAATTPKPSAAAVATPKPAPPVAAATPRPTPKPPVAPTCGAPTNPWGYNLCSGSLIYNPASGFCGKFPCIDTFVSSDDPDGGYVVECVDGMYSWSGGESGACSHHGGEHQPLYQR